MIGSTRGDLGRREGRVQFAKWGKEREKRGTDRQIGHSSEGDTDSRYSEDSSVILRESEEVWSRS